LDQANKKILKIVFVILKIAVSATLLAYLFSKVGGVAIIGNAVLLSPFHLIAASLL
jgi:hypothetical protein